MQNSIQINFYLRYIFYYNEKFWNHGNLRGKNQTNIQNATQLQF